MERVLTTHIRHGRIHGWANDHQNITEDPGHLFVTDISYTTLSDTSSSMFINATTNMALEFNATNLTESSNRRHAVDSSVFIYTASFLIGFCTISLAVNVIILSSVCFMRTRVYPTLYISISLAGADTVSLFFFALGLLLFSLLPRLDIRLNAPCTMLLIEAFRMGAVMTTMFHLAALAGNHYLGILLPLRYPVYMTRRNIQYCIIVLWTIPSTLLILDMFFLEGDWFHKCPFEFLKRSKFRMRFSVPFFMTLGMMIFIYGHIYRLVCKHQEQPIEGKYQGSFKQGKARSSGTTSSQINEKAIVTTLMILGSSIFGWLPAFTYFAFFCEDCLFREYWNLGTVKEFVSIVIINFLLISKTATNIYIYAFRMKEIRASLKRMMQRVRRRLLFTQWAGNNSEMSGFALTRTTSRQSTSRSRTLVYRMNSYQESPEIVDKQYLRIGSLHRCRSTNMSRHKQSNTSV